MNFPQQGWGQQPQQGFGGQPNYGAPQQGPQPVTQSVDQFWENNSGSGGGAPSFDFSPATPRVIGTIVEMQARQQTEMSANGQGKPKFFPDGQPMMQLEVTLQTELRGWAAVKNIPQVVVDPATGATAPKPPDQDDGKRRIYVRYKLLQALNQAIQANGGNKPKIGDKLAAWVVGTEPNKNGGNPIKLYQAALQPGSPAAEEFFGQGQAPAAPPAQPAATQQAQQQAWGGQPQNVTQTPGFQQAAQQQGFQAPAQQPTQQAAATFSPTQAQATGNGWGAAATDTPPF